MSSRDISERKTEWYRRRTGRLPRDRDEVERLYNEAFYELNPRVREMRDLIRKYAESRGGVVLEYLERRWPGYWGRLEADHDPSKVADAMGLPREQEVRILAEMGEWVNARRSYPGYVQRRDEYRFPE